MREAKPEMEPSPSGQHHTSMSSHPEASVSSRWLLPLVAATALAARYGAHPPLTASP
jgi:hypothetical protein